MIFTTNTGKNNMRNFYWKHKFRVSTTRKLVLITAFSGGTIQFLSANDKITLNEQRQSISKLKLNLNSERYQSFIGMTPSGKAIITSTSSDGTATAEEIIQWDITRNRAIKRIPLDKWMEASSIKMSSDGRFLISNSNRVDMSFPEVKSYQITVLNSEDFKIIKSIKLRENEDSVGFVSLSNEQQHIVAKKLTAIPVRGQKYYVFGKDRFEWLNLINGNIDKVISYVPARGCDQIIVSPNKKYLACIFMDGQIDNYDDRTDKESIIDILDYKTGKKVWHIQGTKKHPAGVPLFFLSPTQFVSADSFFNIRTKKVSQWNAASQCIATVPNHPCHALFLSKDELELRNWKTKSIIMRWPKIKTRGKIQFSPNLDMFSYKNGNEVQFWTFKQAWLK